MLTSLMQWLTQYIAGGLDYVTNLFLGAVKLSLRDFITAFPIFATAYDLFRSIGIGLTLIIALLGFYSFFFDKGSDSRAWQEQPWQILLRGIVCGALIWGGGTILEYIVYLAKIPYEMFWHDLDAATTGGAAVAGMFTDKFSADTILAVGAGATAATGSPGTGAAAAVISDGALALISLIMTIVIGWNILKLLLEVCERFLMVGVLVYTAPLLFPTYASAKTEQIFKKWVSMFIGSCVIMALSVFFLNAIINGIYNLNTEGGNYWVQLLLVLAMCKVAQRIDSYMQQLGIGVATTGSGGIADDMLAAAHSLRSLARGARGEGLLGRATGGSKSAVLGQNGSYAPRGNGVFSSLGRGIHDARQSYRSGGSLKQAFKDGVAGTKSQISQSGYAKTGKAVSDAAKAVKNGEPVGKAVGTAAKTIAANNANDFIQGVAPKDAALHQAGMQEKAAAEQEQEAARFAAMQEQAATGREAAVDAGKAYPAAGGGAVDEAALHSAESGSLNEKEAAENLRRFGVAETPDKSGIELNPAESGADPVLGDNLKAAGVVISGDGDKAQFLEGPDAAISNALANEYTDKEMKATPMPEVSADEYRQRAMAEHADEYNEANAKCGDAALAEVQQIRSELGGQFIAETGEMQAAREQKENIISAKADELRSADNSYYRQAAMADDSVAQQVGGIDTQIANQTASNEALSAQRENIISAKASDLRDSDVIEGRAEQSEGYYRQAAVADSSVAQQLSQIDSSIEQGNAAIQQLNGQKESVISAKADEIRAADVASGSQERTPEYYRQAAMSDSDVAHKVKDLDSSYDDMAAKELVNNDDWAKYRSDNLSSAMSARDSIIDNAAEGYARSDREAYASNLADGAAAKSRLITSTAANASSTANLMGLMNRNYECSGNDDLGSTMMEKAFANNASRFDSYSMQSGEAKVEHKFSNVTATTLPAYIHEETQENVAMGRMVTATAKEKGQEVQVSIFDTAGAQNFSLRNADVKLYGFRGSDGNTYYTNIPNFYDENFVAEKKNIPVQIKGRKNSGGSTGRKNGNRTGKPMPDKNK